MGLVAVAVSRNKGQNELPVPAAHSISLHQRIKSKNQRVKSLNQRIKEPVLPSPSCSRLGVLGRGMQQGRRSEPDVEFELGENTWGSGED